MASFKVDDHRAVEVHRSDAGEYWVGLTTIRDPRDWSFSPREQYGKGEHGLSMATKRAESWAREIAFDATRPVYLIHEGGDTPNVAMCADCIDATEDPTATRADIIQRHDAGHCMGCDYHAEDFRTNCMDCYEVGRDID